MLIRTRIRSKNVAPPQPVRKTVELCADHRDGHYCILARGHEGEHESHTPLAVRAWK